MTRNDPKGECTRIHHLIGSFRCSQLLKLGASMHRALKLGTFVFAFTIY